MAKRRKNIPKQNKFIFISVVIVILIGIVASGTLFDKYLANQNLQKAISENPEDSENFDYSGTNVKEENGENLVTYSKLGTGFNYSFPAISDTEVDTSNPEHIPYLVFENVMPFTGSAITFSYVDPNEEIPGNYYSDLRTVSDLNIISRKQIVVDGHNAEKIDAVEERPTYGDGMTIDSSFYANHIFVVVDDVAQAKRYSSIRVESEQKKFVIHGYTGNTKDERAKAQLEKNINEILSTIKFKGN